MAFRLIAQTVTNFNISKLAKIQSALNHCKRNLEKSIDRTFFLWKSLLIKAKTDQAFNAMKTNAIMHGGVAKLEDMRKSRLRYMMVQLALKRRIAAKIRNALVKSRLIARKKLTVAFARWRSYKELAILRSNLLGDATTAFQMPNLNRMMVKFYR